MSHPYPTVGTRFPTHSSSANDAQSADQADCLHCGTPCPSQVRSTEPGPEFCCQGCETVYQLLHEHGLDNFYDLADNAQIPIPQSDPDQSLSFLDDPKIREPLLDFSNGQTAKIRFQIPAIHCNACVWLLEHLFQIDPRIGESQVNFLRKELAVRFDEKALKLSELVQQLHTLGYPPHLQLDQLKPRPKAKTSISRWHLQVGIAGFCFGNIMLLSFPHYLGLAAHPSDDFSLVIRVLPMLLALPVLLFSASDYWRQAFRSLRNGHLRIEVPIAIGLLAIAVESTYQTLIGSQATYWDSLAGLVFFLLCGEGFKQRTLNHLSFDQDYRAFFPLSVLRHDSNRVESVSISEIKTGDRLRIRNQELIPADGRLLRGEASIDYSFVTGEADPIAVSTGSSVRAGGRNLGSALEMITTKPISESYLTSLWSHQIFSKPTPKTVVSLTDRVSRYFTPVVLSIASFGALYWGIHDPANTIPVFVSVLIVACPCALALAAPFATGTALRLLSKRSIHLKSASVIERLSTLTTVVFDKTGTLTQSNSRTIQFDGPPLSPSEQRLVHSVSQHSPHPYSVSIHHLVSNEASPETLEGFEEVEGQGIRATIKGVPLLYGSAQWLLSNGITIPEHSDDRQAGIHLAINDTYRGRFVVTPDLRPEIPRIIDRLENTYDLQIASGDTNRDQDSLRAFFGNNTEMSFNQSPYSKLRVIERLQEQGNQVMFVGDGLNDAGALMQANVGVALMENTAHFCPASDIILDAPLLEELPNVLRFSKSVVKIISASIALSFAYNIAGISLAVSGMLSPLIAAILMPLSSVTIIAFSVGATSWIASQLDITQSTSTSAATR